MQWETGYWVSFVYMDWHYLCTNCSTLARNTLVTHKCREIHRTHLQSIHCLIELLVFFHQPNFQACILNPETCMDWSSLSSKDSCVIPRHHRSPEPRLQKVPHQPRTLLTSYLHRTCGATLRATQARNANSATCSAHSMPVVQLPWPCGFETELW